jgi:hypothetical protein
MTDPQTRRITPMTVRLRECKLIASLLSEPLVQPGPQIRVALAYTNFWEDPQARQVALAIKQCGVRIPVDTLVAEYLEAPAILFNKAFQFENSLPLSVAEHELAADLVRYYLAKRLARVLGETLHALKEQPERVKEIGSELIQAMKAML